MMLVFTRNYLRKVRTAGMKTLYSEKLQKPNFNWNLKITIHWQKNYKTIFMVKHGMKKDTEKKTYGR